MRFRYATLILMLHGAEFSLRAALPPLVTCRPYADAAAMMPLSLLLLMLPLSLLTIIYATPGYATY